MTPQKYPPNFHTPKNIQFSDPPPPQILKFKTLTKKSPSLRPLGTNGPKMKNLPLLKS